MCAAIVYLYRTYDLYYLVLRAGSYFSAVYLYYFADMTQILRAPCSAEAIGDSHRFPPPAAPQEPMVALPFRRLLTSVRPTPVPSTSHPVHTYVPYIQLPDSVPVHKIQFVQSSSTIQSDPAGRCAPFPQRSSRPIRPSFTPQILLMPPHLILHSPQRPLPPYISSPPPLLHILLSSLLRI